MRSRFQIEFRNVTSLMVRLRCVAFSLLAVHSVAAAEMPNIVFLFIDNWAWNGSPMAMDDPMPNPRMPVVQIQRKRLAKPILDGMVLSRVNRRSVCGPTPWPDERVPPAIAPRNTLGDVRLPTMPDPDARSSRFTAVRA